MDTEGCFLSKDQNNNSLQRAPNDLTQTRPSNHSIIRRSPVFNGDAGSLHEIRRKLVCTAAVEKDDEGISFRAGFNDVIGEI